MLLSALLVMILYRYDYVMHTQIIFLFYFTMWLQKSFFIFCTRIKPISLDNSKSFDTPTISLFKWNMTKSRRFKNGLLKYLSLLRTDEFLNIYLLMFKKLTLKATKNVYYLYFTVNIYRPQNWIFINLLAHYLFINESIIKIALPLIMLLLPIMLESQFLL